MANRGPHHARGSRNGVERAIHLSTATYKLTAGFPKEELSTDSQTSSDALASPAPAISPRATDAAQRGEYKQFLAIARGSNLELDCSGAPATDPRPWGGNATHHRKGASIHQRRIH